jgi:hypothetical protein
MSCVWQLGPSDEEMCTYLERPKFEGHSRTFGFKRSNSTVSNEGVQIQTLAERL